jgi:transcriptional antiterminator NusG
LFLPVPLEINMFGGIVVPWFAIYVKSRHEKAVASMLRVKGLMTCLPLVRIRREWSDRGKWLELPAFPGYAFCQFTPDHRASVIATPGVISVLGIGNTPKPIPPDEMHALLTLEHTKSLAEPWPYLKNGQRVRILGGTLDGLTGILADCRKVARVVVSVALLQKSVAVEIDRNRVEILTSRVLADGRTTHLHGSPNLGRSSIETG